MAMNKVLGLITVVLTVLALPSAAAAEFRRIEVKTLGMD